jgi:hypothetical protein
MATHVTGQNAALTAPAQLSAHRRSIMNMLVGCPFITTAEYDTAMQRTLACQSLAILQKWYRNCIREIARREEASSVPAPVVYATANQREEIQRLLNHVSITRREKTRVLLTLNQLDSTQAVATIGSLWAKIISRAGEVPPADGWSRTDVSHSLAA